MNFLRSVKRLSTADELIARFPLSSEASARVERDREEVRAILAGADERFLLVVGPCSAWPDEAVLEYATRLRELELSVRDALKLVLRVYIQKPRTSRGWTGPVNQPDPFAAPDIEAGMLYCRRMMVAAIEMGLAIADEALFTNNARGFAELLAWVAIGARSAEDQEHRIWASGMGAPVGMKNPTSGCIGVGVNSVLAAQSPHVAVFEGCQVETAGNPYAHLVLRGGVEGPNYRMEDLLLARRLLLERGIQNPALLIDASHDNCKIGGRREARAQGSVLREVLTSLRARPELVRLVRGFLVESFLLPGNQDLQRLTRETVERRGLSITDPCLSWADTEALVDELAHATRALRRGACGRARLRLAG
jgi:3-deoxy-7-phosphoheptulonate synthase